jgi:hypothetical protein
MQIAKNSAFRRHFSAPVPFMSTLPLAASTFLFFREIQRRFRIVT